MEEEKKHITLVEIECIILITIVVMCILVYCLAPFYEEYEKKLFDIVSLESENAIEGHFVLGTGYIDTKIAYYFYAITDKGYQKQTLSSNQGDIYIVEDDSKTPCIFEIKKSGEEKSYYVIYVPTGTIIKEYKG